MIYLGKYSKNAMKSNRETFDLSQHERQSVVCQWGNFSHVLLCSSWLSHMAL